jgi:hypothetical protein
MRDTDVAIATSIRATKFIKECRRMVGRIEFDLKRTTPKRIPTTNTINIPNRLYCMWINDQKSAVRKMVLLEPICAKKPLNINPLNNASSNIGANKSTAIKSPGRKQHVL